MITRQSPPRLAQHTVLPGASALLRTRVLCVSTHHLPHRHLGDVYGGQWPPLAFHYQSLLCDTEALKDEAGHAHITVVKYGQIPSRRESLRLTGPLVSVTRVP
jgi:hypothetical protein